MSVWKWKAVNEKGRVLKGTWEERNESYVRIGLRRKKLYPLKIKRSIFSFLQRFQAWRTNQLYWSRLARKTAVLLDAGVPILNICNIFAQGEKHKYKRKQWDNVCLRVESGEELSEALLNGLSPSPGLFFCAMAKAGENSGTLSTTFWQIAEVLQGEYYFKQQLKKALFYPAMILTLSILVIYVLSIVVLPMYESLFTNLNTDLPFVTKCLFYIGHYIPIIIVSFLIVLVLSSIWLRNRMQEKGAGLLYKIPVIGPVIRTKEQIQFSSMMSRLLAAGISLSDSLQLTKRLVKGAEMKKTIADLSLAINQGRRLSPVIQQNGIFPMEAQEMIEIGEESGNLSAMFGHVSTMLHQELEDRLERLAKMLEPLLVLFMAGIVGLVAIGVLLPIFEASTYIR